MQKLCAAYMWQDATADRRDKIKQYTSQHFDKVKWFVEKRQHCDMDPNERPVLRKAVKWVYDNNAEYVTTHVRQNGKRKLESLIWFSQQTFDFHVLEMPSLSRQNVHYAVQFASDDLQVIAGKTRAALQQIKADIADGKAHISHAGNMISKLGAPDPSMANKSKSAKVLERTMSLYHSHLKDMRAEGLSYAAMADRLNRLGISPPFNTVFDQELQEYITFKPGDANYKIWHSTSVRNYFLRGELNAEKNKAGIADEKGSG